MDSEKMKKVFRKLFCINFYIGQRVFWNNPVDDRFRGEYIVAEKKDKRGLVGVRNDDKGLRYAHSYELEPLD